MSALRSGFASARTSIPNARARWATSSPIDPSPRMPIVDPSSPRASPYFFFSQRPARRSTVPSTIRRSTASSSPIVSSATAAAFRPGRLATRTPRAAAASGVDRVRAGAGADDQCQPVGDLEHLAADLGAAHHQRVVPADAAGQVRRLELGLDDAGVAARLELGDGRLDDGVGEKHAHPTLLHAPCSPHGSGPRGDRSPVSRTRRGSHGQISGGMRRSVSARPQQTSNSVPVRATTPAQPATLQA